MFKSKKKTAIVLISILIILAVISAAAFAVMSGAFDGRGGLFSSDSSETSSSMTGEIPATTVYNTNKTSVPEDTTTSGDVSDESVSSSDDIFSSFDETSGPENSVIFSTSTLDESNTSTFIPFQTSIQVITVPNGGTETRVITFTRPEFNITFTQRPEESTNDSDSNTPGSSNSTESSTSTTTSKATVTTVPNTTTTVKPAVTTTIKTTTKATTTAKKTTTTAKKTTTTAGTTLYKEITPKTMYVISGGVTLKKEPSQNSGNLLVLPAGTAVNVVGETGNWYAISYSGKIVFANKSYFSSTKPATTTTTTTSEPSTPSTPYYDYDAASEMCGLVNELRAEWGRNELEVNEALMKAARVRAKELAECFSHQRPNGDGGTSAADEFLSGLWYVGENIGKTNVLGSSYMFKLFEKSSGHMGTMISSEFTMMGIGCYIVEDEEYGHMMFCCQLFAGYDD